VLIRQRANAKKALDRMSDFLAEYYFWFRPGPFTRSSGLNLLLGNCVFKFFQPDWPGATTAGLQHGKELEN
jgi:hypothetical protein